MASFTGQNSCQFLFSNNHSTSHCNDQSVWPSRIKIANGLKPQTKASQVNAEVATISLKWHMASSDPGAEHFWAPQEVCMSEFTQSETLIGLEYSGWHNSQIVTFNKHKLTLNRYQKLVKQKTLMKMNFENSIQKCSKNVLLKMISCKWFNRHKTYIEHDSKESRNENSNYSTLSKL